MKIHTTVLSGLVVIDSELFSDHRGSFTRLFCSRELASVLGARQVVQTNRSVTYACGAVRGLHYQHPPYAEMKLVRCLRGSIWDVAVDLRVGSPTFLCWHAEELSVDNARMMVIPEGFAHGFQTLEENSEIFYQHTAFYAPSAEGGIAWNDPILDIHWPLPVVDLSIRDSSHLLLTSSFSGIYA